MRNLSWILPAAVLSIAVAPACSDKSDDDFNSGGRAGSVTGGASGSAGSSQAAAPGTGGMGGSDAGSAGTPSSGGTGVGGSGETGGAGSGGIAGAGGSGGLAGTGGGISTPCGITAEATTSTAIPTVGIVTWSTDLPGVTEASIEFGLTTTYGLTAPVILSQPSYRTVLLGMKPSRPYHYRVVVRAGQNVCTGPDQTLMTGALAGTLPTVNQVTTDENALAGGYLVGTISQGGNSFILDGDGDIVWWFTSGAASRAILSHDSLYMWFLTTNQGGGAPNVRRVSIDGVGGVETHTEFGDAHHDMVVVPDGSIGFMMYDTTGRDHLMERALDGNVREVIDIPTAHGGVTANHSNSIQYFAPDDSYTFSDLDQNCYVKVSRQGQVAWVLGGTTSQFTGPGATWTREHGHHLLAPDRLLFFNNGERGTDAVMREVTLDLVAKTATTTWMYAGGEASTTLGDVERLWNGNTLVTYSNAGIIHEVDAAGTLLQTTSFSTMGGTGYSTKRKSLYGPGPKTSSP